MTAATVDDWLAKVNALPEPERTKMLQWAEQQAIRRRSMLLHPSPADLAASIEPGYVITPAIARLSAALERTLRTRRGRSLITMPPQEGKSELVGVWTVIRALQQQPDRRVILTSFSADLAELSSSRARNIIAANGTGAVDPITQAPVPDRLGLRLATDKARAAHWRLHGQRGGMVAVGFGGTITGRPADVLIIDDPLKGMASADSATERRRVIEGFQGDLTTRLSPSAPIILIQTRWHEGDLAGWILKKERSLPPEKRRWEWLNIPAQAEEGLPDALGRDPGEYLLSTRGRRKEDWEETKNAVGRRVWSALYQGVPTPTGGGLFSPSDLDTYRGTPGRIIGRAVSVDPSESGHGDEAGLIELGWDENSVVWVLRDRSRPMTSDAWSREAVLMCLESGAVDLVMEAFSATQTYTRVVKLAWEEILRISRAILRGEQPPTDEVGMETWNRVSALGPLPDEPPFRVVPWRAPGDKVARAAGARQATSIGKMRMSGEFRQLETQMCTWQQGQGSPDRVDALVNGYEHIATLIGSVGFDLASPFG